MLVELLVHLKGRGDASDYSTSCPGDVQDVRPAGFSWGRREAMASWLLHGGTAQDWPATFGIVQMDLTNPRRIIEEDRTIYVRAGDRVLTTAEKSALRQAVADGQMTIEEVKAEAKPKGSCGVYRDGARIGTLGLDEIRQIKSDTQTVDSIQEITLKDDLDGRDVDLEYKVDMVRKRRWAIQATQAERQALREGEVVSMPPSRLYDKRLG